MRDIFQRLKFKTRTKKPIASVLSLFFSSFFFFLFSSFFLLSSFSSSAQQVVPHFSNYLFNNYGLNPAYLSSGNCLEIKVGRRNQWVGFPNSPITTFISANKSFGKKAFRNSWHGVGIYLEQDKQDFIKTDAFYPSYSYHLKVSQRYYASFGVFAGVKLYSVAFNLYDPNDPAFSSVGNIFVLPDIAVGGRLYSKSYFFDLAVRQVYKNKVQFGAKKMGSPSKLVPHINFIAGKKIESSAYYYSYIPSVNLKFAYLAPPTVDLSFMMFIKNQIGFGLSYRYNDAIIGMAQYRYKNMLTLAVSYEYILSRLRVGTSNSREIMLGFSSCPPGQDMYRATGCPAYDH